MAQARAQIVEEKANREFTLGQYYEQHKYYGAARMYYKSVIDEYPSTREGQGSPGADGEDSQRARRAAQSLRVADRDVRAEEAVSGAIG